ncbi:MAG: asparagine synthase (glutamine-hydrolyzing) [Bacteroidetes bacterium]|nr:asparagine synthase (glutamine-hydrolyzing) [Bacteroidota bacterium]
MCGIAGFIDLKNNSSKDLLIKITDVLTHRGPDGGGYEFFQHDHCQVGLGHRRLSIIDLSAAASQPMWYKQFAIIFNGEMYNYAEVKKELEQLGHSFITHSDTEVILHAWEQWGAAMIDRFIGMFTLAIYDTEKQEMTCFRDRAGVKPFYYYWHNGLFMFASELKSFHQHPQFVKVINQQALHQFLQYGYIQAPLSIFEHTHKLLPGHYLKFSTRQNSFSIHKYWDVYDFYNKPKLDITETEAKDHAEKLLISACQYRMVADVPVGVFLSGGYDSTAVTALLQANQQEKLKTYTIGFFEEDHNEAVWAKKVATFLQTDHTEHYCTTREAQEIIPDIPFYCDEPFGDSSMIPTTLVSRLARKEVTVALSADAGDETFAGYNKYPLAMDFLRKINQVPAPLRKPAGKILNFIPNKVLEQISGNTAVAIKKQRLSDLFQQPVVTAPAIMDVLLSQVYTSKQLEDLLYKHVPKPESFFDSENMLNRSLGEIDRMLAVDYKTYMPDDILVKVDRAGMSTSLEGREPLLDHRLIEFAARLPERYKMTNDNKKILLKNIVHDYLPKEMMERPKMGFGVPVFAWLRGDLAYYADEYMNDEAFKKHGLFKMDGVHHIIQQFFKGDRNYNNLFWYLLMFQMWYKKWMA